MVELKIQLMAAALAHGTTTIINAAKEPEIVQLCEVLANSGIKFKVLELQNYN